MSRIKRSGKQLLLTFNNVEEPLLESLVEQLIRLLEGDTVPTVGDDPFARWAAEMAPTDDLDTSDPVIARLFPPAYPEQEAAEQEFRRYTVNAQRNEKLEHAQLVLHALEETHGGTDRAIVRAFELEAWLKTITAIRLILSVRLDIKSAADIEELEQIPHDESRGALYGIYEWLGYFLEELVLSIR